ncbi:hypothetical protein HYS93_03390 [Candidatus Daviesbacteria bacterium]|nr:hypothetical protein [Candidatus Daviesbacteria bacterium]
MDILNPKTHLNLPVFVHLPLILNPDGQGKLSKRQQSASVDFYKQEGFLPEAILNYLSNIVWNHPEGKEVYSLEEFIKLFKISDLQNKGARFDLSKLEWMNGEYIRGLSDEELTKRLQEFLVDLSDGALAKSDYPAKDKILKVVPLIKERIKKLSDFVPLTNFIFQKPEYDLAEFKKIKIENVKEVLEKIRESLDTMKKPWNAETFEKTFRDMVEKLKIPAREMFQLIRLAVSGQLVTPPLFDSIELIGEDEVLNRVKELATIYPKISDSSEDLSLKEKD